MKLRCHRQHRRPYWQRVKGFTFVEVLLALSILLIGLVPLLHLLAKSISVMDSARCLSQATLIGSAKLAEAMSTGSNEIDTDSGRVEIENSDLVFEWEVRVLEESLKELKNMNVNQLRKINVTVIWNEGIRQRQVTLSTYVALDQIVVRTSSEEQNTP